MLLLDMGNLRKIVQNYVSDALNKKVNFPHDYCNVASKELKNILLSQGFSVKEMFSYREKGDGHTFLMTDDGLIIDPTYGQYDKRYIYGLIGNKFPNRILMKNIMSGEKYMKLQQKRYSGSAN